MLALQLVLVFQLIYYNNDDHDDIAAVVLLVLHVYWGRTNWSDYYAALQLTAVAVGIRHFSAAETFVAAAVAVSVDFASVARNASWPLVNKWAHIEQLTGDWPLMTTSKCFRC